MSKSKNIENAKNSPMPDTPLGKGNIENPKAGAPSKTTADKTADFGEQKNGAESPKGEELTVDGADPSANDMTDPAAAVDGNRLGSADWEDGPGGDGGLSSDGVGMDDLASGGSTDHGFFTGAENDGHAGHTIADDLSGGGHTQAEIDDAYAAHPNEAAAREKLGETPPTATDSGSATATTPPETSAKETAPVSDTGSGPEYDYADLREGQTVDSEGDHVQPEDDGGFSRVDPDAGPGDAADGDYSATRESVEGVEHVAPVTHDGAVVTDADGNQTSVEVNPQSSELDYFLAPQVEYSMDEMGVITETDGAGNSRVVESGDVPEGTAIRDAESPTGWSDSKGNPVNEYGEPVKAEDSKDDDDKTAEEDETDETEDSDESEDTGNTDDTDKAEAKEGDGDTEDHSEEGYTDEYRQRADDEQDDLNEEFGVLTPDEVGRRHDPTGNDVDPNNGGDHEGVDTTGGYDGDTGLDGDDDNYGDEQYGGDRSGDFNPDNANIDYGPDSDPGVEGGRERSAAEELGVAAPEREIQDDRQTTELDASDLAEAMEPPSVAWLPGTGSESPSAKEQLTETHDTYELDEKATGSNQERGGDGAKGEMINDDVGAETALPIEAESMGGLEVDQEGHGSSSDEGIASGDSEGSEPTLDSGLDADTTGLYTDPYAPEHQFGELDGTAASDDLQQDDTGDLELGHTMEVNIDPDFLDV